MSLELENKLEEGLAHCIGRRWPQAKACYEAALALDPDNKIAWNDLGNVHFAMGQSAAAVSAYQHAVQIDPSYEAAWGNLNSLHEFRKEEPESIECLKKLLTLPLLPTEAARYLHKLGLLLHKRSHIGVAFREFESAAQLVLGNADYDHSYLFGMLETCAHGHLDAHVQAMKSAFADTAYRAVPFPLLSAIDDPAWHLAVARRHLERLSHETPIELAPAVATIRSITKKRIRIAYLSPDWHSHPVPQQLLPVIELHDRNAFEVIGIATDTVADTRDFRKRIERGFDHFYALGHLSDAQIAAQLRAMNIHIVVDLALYTKDGRPHILANRPCKVQVAYLGYPATSGAPWMDYLVADDVTIPPAHEVFYSEKVLRVTGSFMPDSNERPVMQPAKDRAAALIQQGLPEDAFIFCAFNNVAKITPEMMRCWCRLLHAMPKSVLWLQTSSQWAKANLQAAAQAAGLAPERLIFATRVDSFEAHLQRYALADLFLDTSPYNAHVTAADSLWAGLPVLTLQGKSFASRVASSILTALELPELITTDLASYEALALALAKDPKRLQGIKQKLEQSKASGLYFDQRRYVRELEQVYRNMLP